MKTGGQLQTRPLVFPLKKHDFNPFQRIDFQIFKSEASMFPARHFLASLLMLIGGGAQAQTPATLRGTVADAETGEALSFRRDDTSPLLLLLCLK